MKRIPAVTEVVVVEPAKVVFNVGTLIRTGEGFDSHHIVVTKGMGGEYIPEVTKIKVVVPEKVIFEPGDWVKIYDFSYIMKVSRDSSEHSLISTPYPETLHKDRQVRIIEMGLKVPYPSNESENLIAMDSDDHLVYLDTIIKDSYGNYFLTQARFLFL